MNRITIENLNYLVDMLNQATDNPIKPYVRNDDGHTVAQGGNFHLDHAYGGIALHQMLNGGGIRDVLNSGHVTKKDLYQRMQAFLEGVLYEQRRSLH